MLHGRLELGVLALERGVGRVIDDDVRVDRVALDQPNALWAADPGMPEVEDARKRLAGLTGS